ncbi:glucan endo-1,3-beta-glucosidase 4-like [Phalaenopsis equestris]|uniref:glucan endo-1,3-beta-glucosidase 4-like n=1 Tax=Phalaenopsis equestris TaxID=78828 RepID=UPI0009E2C9E1|nr:glucan endo-1,3-beta-glucosidase 4-like [Phalaenopsis equestris]XP_020582666.1 glucan endo-1,3-beta-glucosidase 4-like [Phalaenopsis equestris]
MLLGIWRRGIVLLAFLFSHSLGSFVGINIGTDISDLPSPSTIVSILQAQNINHVRLFDADHQLLTALSNTGIEVMVGVPNHQLPQIGESRSAAADWINKNIAPYLPGTNITYISVGNEALTSVPSSAPLLVLAMQFIHSALLAANLDSQIHVSSPHSINVIPQSFPPSTATFNSTLNSIMYQHLQFLKNTGSSFMLNAQPYYLYSKANGIYPIDYALFRALDPDNQILDPNTLLSYTNMFDTMVDAAYYSMQALNFTGIPVIVTESGWPSSGGDNESDANVDNALAYNTNLIHHVLNNSGTPSRRKTPINAYIYELFNEDLRAGPPSEKNWGVFFSNETAVYSLSFAGGSDNGTSSPGLPGVFCVAKSSASTKDLERGLDWACGSGGANCSLIQPGQPCYESGNLFAVASYAYNDYYHRTQGSGGTCNFGGTAMITANDPSHGSCIFAGSATTNSTASNGAASDSGSIAGFERRHAFSTGYLALVMLLIFFCC